MADLEFRRDLYRGIAHDYDQFRVPYPRSLIDDLAERSGATGRGRLLDLACGTGQVTFALAGRVGIIDHGHIVAEGSPAELKREVGRPTVEVVPADPSEEART